MVMIPVNNPIEKALDHGCEEQLPRTYLGYSGLAHQCRRYQWLGFRWCFKKKVTKRLKRIFERGDLEEARVICDLKEIGCEVYMIDKEGNKKEIFGKRDDPQEQVVGLAEHVKGHLDGRVIGLPGAEKTEHLLEIKTMKDKKFRDLVKAGADQKAIKKVFPVYYGQMMSYMGKTGLKRALFITTNKDNEERRYIRVKFDEDEFKHLEGVAVDILTSPIPPKRIGDAIYFECKWCDAHSVCHNADTPPLRTCRSCSSVCLEEKGKWTCEVDGKELSKEKQEKACHMYSPIVEIKDMNMKKD